MSHLTNLGVSGLGSGHTPPVTEPGAGGFDFRGVVTPGGSSARAAELLPADERRELAAQMGALWDITGPAPVQAQIGHLHSHAARQAEQLQDQLPDLWKSLEQLQNQSQQIDSRMGNIGQLDNPADALHLMYDVMRLQRTTELISKLVGETIGTVQKLTVKAEG